MNPIFSLESSSSNVILYFSSVYYARFLHRYLVVDARFTAKTLYEKVDYNETYEGFGSRGDEGREGACLRGDATSLLQALSRYLPKVESRSTFPPVEISLASWLLSDKSLIRKVTKQSEKKEKIRLRVQVGKAQYIATYLPKYFMCVELLPPNSTLKVLK